MNTSGCDFPKNSRFYDIIQSKQLFDLQHIMNLCAHSNHEKLQYSGSSLMLKNVSTLEQMFQDAFENAVTFASTGLTIYIDIYMVTATTASALATLDPAVDKSARLVLNEFSQRSSYYWKSEISVVLYPH